MNCPHCTGEMVRNPISADNYFCPYCITYWNITATDGGGYWNITTMDGGAYNE